MPRVNIHEVDNTKSGTRAYQNFTVVVPGFHAPYCSREMLAPDLEAIDGIVLDKESIDPVTGVKSYPALTDKEVFGDEGILEIKTQADFEQLIGFVKPQSFNEGFKAAAITRIINEEDVYGDPSKITYFNGSNVTGSEFPVDENFTVDQNKEDKLITFTYRYNSADIADPYITGTNGKKEPNPNYDPDKDGAFSEKYDVEEKITYKYDVNGFDVTLYKRPIVKKVGQPPFAKVGKDEFNTVINKDATGALCDSKGNLFVLDENGKIVYVIDKDEEGNEIHIIQKDADGNVLYKEARDEDGKIIYKEVEGEDGKIVKEIVYEVDEKGEKIPQTVPQYTLTDDNQMIPVYQMALAVDYDFDNPVPASEAFVLLNDEQKIHMAGCRFSADSQAVYNTTDYANNYFIENFPDEFEEIKNGMVVETVDAEGKKKPDKEIEAAKVAAAKEAIKVQYVKAFQWCPEIRLPAHYGNQIAYELLGLGYTVYYVNMGEWNPTKEETGLFVKDELTGYYKRDAEGNYIINEDPDNVGLANIDKAYKALGTEDFWANLRDKTTYDFRFVLTGFIKEGNFTKGCYRDYMKNANFEISKLAAWEAPGEDAFAHVRARGDCLALIDLDEDNIDFHFASTAGGQGNTTKRLVKAIQQDIRRQNFGIYGKYSAIFTPSVTYANNLKQDVYQNCKFPASFHYLACFAKSVFADNYKEWFAVAGFTRGLSTYNIDSVGFNLGDVAMNALEPRFFVNGSPVNVAVNVIVNNRGSYYIWGNRTCHTLGTELTASHFLNIRQLCITLKKYIYVLCRKFTFDPNSDVLWANFVNGLTPTLENMKANQGIRDYAIEKVPTDLKGVLAAKVRIVPIEAVEDFEITVSLEDSLEATVGE